MPTRRRPARRGGRGCRRYQGRQPPPYLQRAPFTGPAPRTPPVHPIPYARAIDSKSPLASPPARTNCCCFLGASSPSAAHSPGEVINPAAHNWNGIQEDKAGDKVKRPGLCDGWLRAHRYRRVVFFLEGPFSRHGYCFDFAFLIPWPFQLVNCCK